MGTKIVKLVTQEEIICKHEYKDETGNHILKNPCIIIMSAEGFGAMPWLPCGKTEEGVAINESFVMAVVDPIDEMRNEYETKFGSGLVVPTAPMGLA